MNIQFNETIALNEEVLESIRDIKLFNSLNEEKCSVTLKRLNDNYLNECRDKSFEQNSNKSRETIESKSAERQNRNNERANTSEEIPERKFINLEIKIEDIEKENNSFISVLLIEKQPNIEESENISINLINTEINVNSETNISDIEFNSRTGHQLNETLNQKIVKIETQRDDNSEQISNESQTRIEAIEECKREEECIESTQHMEQVIDEENEEFRFLTENNLKTIERLIPQTTEQVFICDICSTNFKNKYSLREHKNRHSNKFQCKVKGCGYRAGKSSHLKRHMRAKHVYRINDPIIQNGFKCEVCSAVLKTRQTLVEHKNKHTNRFACSWSGCLFRGRKLYDLRKHRTRVHSKTKPFNYYFKDSNKRIEIENNSNESLIPQISHKTQENNELNDISIYTNDECEDNRLNKSQLRVNKSNENISHKRIRSEEEMIEDSDEERAKKLMDHKSLMSAITTHVENDSKVL